eukprot:952428-Pelagomonas_calceolata.AAC.2
MKGIQNMSTVKSAEPFLKGSMCGMELRKKIRKFYARRTHGNARAKESSMFSSSWSQITQPDACSCQRNASTGSSVCLPESRYRAGQIREKN